MYCPKCGKELPEGAKFCVHCGKAVSEKLQQRQKQGSTTEVFTSNQVSERAFQEPAGNMQQQGAVILQKKKSNGLKAIVGIAIALAAVIGSIFAIRSYNEQKMIRQIPQLICDDETQETVRTYYTDYLGESIMVGWDAEDFSVKQGSDSDSFELTGLIEVTDISQTSRPTYGVGVTGTVTTNFFRTKYSATHQLDYEVPEPKLTYATLAGHYVAGPTDNEIYPSLYISIDGSTLWISLGTYRGSEGSFDVEFSPESNWPKIEDNTIQFTAKEMYWDETYDITLEYLPAVTSSNGADTIYLKGPSQFKNWEFVRLDSSNGIYNAPSVDATGEYDDIAGTYIDEYGYGFYLFIGYDDSSKQAAYANIALVMEDVLVKLERDGNFISGSDFYRSIGSAPSQIVDMVYNPLDGSITATIYADTIPNGDTIRFVAYPNAPYSNPFYID